MAQFIFLMKSFHSRNTEYMDEQFKIVLFLIEQLF